MPPTAQAAVHPVSSAAGNTTQTQEEQKEKEKQGIRRKKNLIDQIVAALDDVAGDECMFCTKLKLYLGDRTKSIHLRHFQDYQGDKVVFELLGCHIPRHGRVELIAREDGQDKKIKVRYSEFRQAHKAAERRKTRLVALPQPMVS